jgi:hypothetical protein
MVTFLCDMPETLKMRLEQIITTTCENMDMSVFTLDKIPTAPRDPWKLLPEDVSVKTVKVLAAIDPPLSKPVFAKYIPLLLNEGAVDPRTELSKQLAALGMFNAFSPSGSFHYPPDGGQSWHTNYDDLKLDDSRNMRIYLTHNDTDTSEFRVYDKITDKRTIHAEPIGWSARVFDLTDPLWHCVVAGGTRISLGLMFRYTPT